MERARKMVLVSTENLDKLRRVTNSTTDNTTGQNSEEEIASVQTPGTPLSRLDTEMSQILNSTTPTDTAERWKLYRSVLQRYLHFVGQKRNRKREIHEDSIIGEDSEEDARERDECEGEKTEEKEEGSKNYEVASPMMSPFAATNVIKSPDKVSDISINKILQEVPKTYRVKARLLMKHLLQTAIPSRLRWNEEGVVTIDGKVVLHSNISDLVNEATRERKYTKATGRLQFARLLRRVDTPDEFIGNRTLMSAVSLAPRSKNLNVQKGGKRRSGKSVREDNSSDGRVLYATVGNVERRISPTKLGFDRSVRSARKNRILAWSRA